jgi:hypothetical protein
MTPGKLPIFDDPASKKPEGGFHRVNQEMEMIFRPITARPHLARDHHAARAPLRPREQVLAQSPRRLATGQAAALVLFGLCQMAILAGALASVDRNGTSTSRGATSMSAETNRPAEETALPETRPAAGATSLQEQKPNLPRQEASDGPAAPRARQGAPVARFVGLSKRSEPRALPPVLSATDAGEEVVRSFYGALGRGDGEEASAHVVAEKRSSAAFSPEGISRFYGGLREPLRLTAVTPLGNGEYRVSYRYSAGRSRCNGEAVVSLASDDQGKRIHSIRALNGC